MTDIVAPVEIVEPVAAATEVVAEVPAEVPAPITTETDAEAAPAKTRKRRQGPKSCRKQAAIRCNIRVTAWQTAAKSHGFIQKGAFVKIPKRGTPEYEAIKETQRKLEAEWSTAGGIPEQCKLREPPPVTEKKTEADAAPVAEGAEPAKPAKRKRGGKKKNTDDAATSTETPVPAPAEGEKPKEKRKRKRAAPAEGAAETVEDEPKPKRKRVSKKKCEVPEVVPESAPAEIVA